MINTFKIMHQAIYEIKSAYRALKLINMYSLPSFVQISHELININVNFDGSENYALQTAIVLHPGNCSLTYAPSIHLHPAMPKHIEPCCSQ
jgi:hypothetical protein